MNTYRPTEKICRNGNAAWKIVFDKLWDGNRMTFLTPPICSIHFVLQYVLLPKRAYSNQSRKYPS